MHLRQEEGVPGVCAGSRREDPRGVHSVRGVSCAPGAVRTFSCCRWKAVTGVLRGRVPRRLPRTALRKEPVGKLSCYLQCTSLQQAELGAVA